jgi:predicted AAA+ superfamily ATPase
MTDYLPREPSRRLERAPRQLRVVVLSGLRQTGGSTLLQREPGLARNHQFILLA